jgi:hypothetical protein
MAAVRTHGGDDGSEYAWRDSESKTSTVISALFLAKEMQVWLLAVKHSCVGRAGN